MRALSSLCFSSRLAISRRNTAFCPAFLLWSILRRLTASFSCTLRRGALKAGMVDLTHAAGRGGKTYCGRVRLMNTEPSKILRATVCRGGRVVRRQSFSRLAARFVVVAAVVFKASSFAVLALVLLALVLVLLIRALVLVLGVTCVRGFTQLCLQ